jgi:hypothetical protein
VNDRRGRRRPPGELVGSRFPAYHGGVACGLEQVIGLRNLIPCWCAAHPVLDLSYRIVARTDPHRDEIRPPVAVDAGLSELAKQSVDARLRHPQQHSHFSLGELWTLGNQERSSSLKVRSPGFRLSYRQCCITPPAADVIAAIVQRPRDSYRRQCIERRATDPSRNQQRASIVWGEPVNVTDPKISDTPTQRSRPPPPRR